MKPTTIITFSIFASMITIVLFSFRPSQGFDLKASIGRGKEIYLVYCLSCHMDQGTGIENLYPPLAGSDYLIADKKRSIQQILYGATDTMKVNGKSYATPMAGVNLTDEQASDLLNYVRNSWKNKGVPVKPAEVKAARK